MTTKLIKRIALLVLGDILLAILALYAISMVGIHQKYEILQVRDIIIFASGLILSSYLFELYTTKKIYSFVAKERLAAVIYSLLFSFVIISAILFLIHSEVMGRRLLIFSLGVFGMLQVLWHYSYVAIVNDASMAQKVLILGTGDLARKIERTILLKQTNYVFGGYYAGSPNTGDEHDASSQDICAGLLEYAKEKKIGTIVMALTERRGAYKHRELVDCKFAGIEIVDAHSFYEEIMGKLLIEYVTPAWFIFSDGFKLGSQRKIIKRIVDIFCALIGLILSLPLFPLLALLIKMESRGPIFYQQLRVGEGEKTFLLIKFRTMKQDAESATGAIWAQKNDQRVTRIGRILRKLRLDELPQFINVLRGEMSLIGPRPERPEFVEKLKLLIPYYCNRHFVKPGITGWAQIKYPYGASAEDSLEKLRYDLYYIKNLSPLLDM